MMSKIPGTPARPISWLTTTCCERPEARRRRTRPARSPRRARPRRAARCHARRAATAASSSPRRAGASRLCSSSQRAHLGAVLGQLRRVVQVQGASLPLNVGVQADASGSGRASLPHRSLLVRSPRPPRRPSCSPGWPAAAGAGRRSPPRRRDRATRQRRDPGARRGGADRPVPRRAGRRSRRARGDRRRRRLARRARRTSPARTARGWSRGASRRRAGSASRGRCSRGSRRRRRRRRRRSTPTRARGPGLVGALAGALDDADLVTASARFVCDGRRRAAAAPVDARLARLPLRAGGRDAPRRARPRRSPTARCTAVRREPLLAAGGYARGRRRT